MAQPKPDPYPGTPDAPRRSRWPRALILVGALLAATSALAARRYATAPAPRPAATHAAPALPTPEAHARVALAPPRPADDAVGVDVWAVPKSYRGEVVRRRVRHFPEKLLALTFDDGPDPVVTPRILDALAECGAHATFFVQGNHAARHPELLRRIAAEGHAIGNHSYTHPEACTPAQAEEELARTDRAVADATGRRPALFRPPFGIVRGSLTRAAHERGYTTVLWTISSADTRPIGPAVIARNVIHTPNPGDIVIMHDGPGHTRTAEALPRVLKELGAAGFRFVTLPELMRAWDARKP